MLNQNGIIQSMRSIVAIDIETTGLNLQSDAITEIGAVRFTDRRVEAEWSTLINPNRPIPHAITQLTGITNEMVRNAPPIRAVIHEFEDFVANAPVLGHNINFDLSFLRRHDILLLNDIIDTYDLASVLLPTASRYNLGALGQELGILLPGTHRALDDARLTHAIYKYLYKKALSLPLDLIAEFVRLSETFDWGAAWFFREILQSRAKQPISIQHTREHENGPLFKQTDVGLYPPIVPAEINKPLDTDKVVALMEHGGAFSKLFNNYEQRPQQIEMLRVVTQAISESQHLMVEAGTGIGKSFAYLIPAALWAVQNNQRVVISTNTINLQDQLINKDIPDLRKVLEIDLKTAVLKGRTNYLCPRRLEAFRRRPPENAEEIRVLAKILVWLHEGGSGDRNEINLNSRVERNIWMRFSAADENCKAEVCFSRMGGICPFFQARQAAQSAHIIIVNHALLLADIATGSRVLPDYDHLIVDEAHHLESATTNALSYSVSLGDISRLSRELGGTSSGIMGHLLRLLKNILPPIDFAICHKDIQRSTDLNFQLDHSIKIFFRSIEVFLEEQREGRSIGVYRQQERIMPATRTQPAWSEVEIAWDLTNGMLDQILNLIAQLLQLIKKCEVNEIEEIEDVQGSLSNMYRRLTEAKTNLTTLVSNPEDSNIYWAEINPKNNLLTLNIAPLHIGPLMEQYLWHEKASIILTSATLTTNGEFDYIRNQLYADEAEELALGSPFDFENATLLYLVDDIPVPPNSPNYQRPLEHTLIQLSKATGGRLLALFTSYAQLKRTSEAIGPVLSKAGIQVYEQGGGASANTLLENFRTAEKAVLLGTRSFWEGVDVPGEALSVLVIVKLPFDVPSDPIIAARAEIFDDPFYEYNLPEAILRFRQGFGRLIRTQYDRGVVVILDRRVLTKRYGRAFIESLPKCTTRIGHMHDLPSEAVRWLNL